MRKLLVKYDIVFQLIAFIFEINFSVMGGRSQGQWSIVNDDVMGGVSQGSAQAVDDVLLFKGDISLENNGGFSSVSFKPESKMDMSASTVYFIKVKGKIKTFFEF